MNNRFFVSVLALGIAALGAASSPSQAATATLGFYEDSSNIPSWLDSVTTTDSTSSWDTATALEADDGGPYRVVGQQSPHDTGSGTFNIHTAIMPPPDGHSYNFLIQNYGSSQGGSVSWEVSAGPGSVSNRNGFIYFNT